MTTIFVQFADSAKTTVISVFGCAQDAKSYENLGTIDDSDERYAAFFESLPAFAQEGLVVPSS